MDPVTAVVVSTVMSLLNGAVLGFIEQDLPPTMRPSALAWRRGTLLIAGGCVLLAMQQFLPPLLVLPLGNAMLLFGVTSYWLSLRRFRGLPERWWLFAPSAAATLGIAWFSGPQPSLKGRVIIGSAALVVSLVGAGLVVRQANTEHPAVSHRVMGAVLGLLTSVLLLRGFYFITGGGGEHTIVDAGSVVNGLTPIVVASLPVAGTTSYLLMLSERLRHNWVQAAMTDHLTGLSNRRTLSETGAMRLREARSRREGLALAIVDVDHFKGINDRFGHDVGDLALKHVAERIRAACRADDFPARQGGEEFVVLFNRVDAAQAVTAAERLRLSVAGQPFVGGTLPIELTVSIGVAVLEASDAQLDDLLRRADRCLYEAKASGRNCVKVAAPVALHAPSPSS